jgi:hypothetical protein
MILQHVNKQVRKQNITLDTIMKPTQHNTVYSLQRKQKVSETTFLKVAYSQKVFLSSKTCAKSLS